MRREGETCAEHLARYEAAKQEWAALKAAKAEGLPLPATPKLDEIRQENDIMSKTTTTRKAAARKPGQTVTYTVNGKPKALKNRTYTLGYMAAEAKMSTADLRALLAKAGVSDPEHTAWDVELPSGMKVGAVLGDAGVAAAQLAQPEPAKPAAAKPARGKATTAAKRDDVTPIPKKAPARKRTPKATAAA